MILANLIFPCAAAENRIKVVCAARDIAVGKTIARADVVELTVNEKSIPGDFKSSEYCNAWYKANLKAQAALSTPPDYYATSIDQVFGRECVGSAAVRKGQLIVHRMRFSRGLSGVNLLPLSPVKSPVKVR